MEKQNFGTSTVEALCNEHGHCYLDTYVAQSFARASGQPETSVLNVLRRQERSCLSEESGRGKFERAKERACMLLASGWEQGEGGHGYGYRSTCEMLASMEPAAVYGMIARTSAQKVVS